MKARECADAARRLVERPIAHRGLHDRASGVVENSLGAARAALVRGFAIECDLQLTADLDAVVFHDAALDRLTALSGPVMARRVGDLAATALRGTTDCVPTLASLLRLVGGRVPLICELKSAFDGDMRLPDRVADLVRSYPGPLALKSFDPAVIAHLRSADLPCPLGIVAEARYDDADWPDLSPDTRLRLRALLHFTETRPDFLSYRVDDLPHAAPFLCRSAWGMPIMAWTVRTDEQRQRAAIWADQMVFEGFVP